MLVSKIFSNGVPVVDGLISDGFVEIVEEAVVDPEASLEQLLHVFGLLKPTNTMFLMQKV